MNIIITVNSKVEKELVGGAFPSEQTRQLLKCLEENSAEIRPMYSGADNEAYPGYFLVVADSRQSAQVLLNRLNTLPAVTSAYIKPLDANPM